jgi:hypothetical protein
MTESERQKRKNGPYAPNMQTPILSGRTVGDGKTVFPDTF